MDHKMNFAENDILLSSPGLYVLSGPTSCVHTIISSFHPCIYLLQGKSYLSRALILNNEWVFDNKMAKIFYCYTDYQPSFDQMKASLGSKIEFVKGFSGHKFFTEHGLNDRSEQSEPILICLGKNIAP